MRYRTVGVRGVWCALVVLGAVFRLAGWGVIAAGAAPISICGAGGFCWEHPLPQGNPILAAWGSSPRDVWLLGTAGTILHHDGKGWSSVASGSDADLIAIWGSGASDVWAAGTGGTLVHFDGHGWTVVASPTRRTLRGLWGRARDTLWAVGDRGTILRFDGQVWSEQPSGIRENLFAVEGSGTDEVWAVGAAGMILRYTGGRWMRVVSPTIQALRELWIPRRAAGEAVSPEVWAIAFAGPNLRWQGTRWEAMPRPPGPRFAVLAAWRTPDGATLALDRCGTVYRDHDGHWVESGGGPAALHMVSPDPVAGDRVGLPSSLVGLTPRAGCDGAQGAPPVLRGLSSGGNGAVWAVGLGGAVLRSEGGGIWEPVEVPTRADLESVWVRESGEVWLAGGGAVLRRAAAGPWVPAADGLGTWTHAVGGRADEVWAIGEEGMVARWTGVRWKTMPSGTTLPLRAVWASGRDRTFAVGGQEASGAGAARGGVLRFDGRRWSMATTTDVALLGVHGTDGEVWAVGEKGTVLRFDGRRWSRVEAGTHEDLNGVWVGGRNEVWVVGRQGTILRFDGHTWQPETGLTRNHLLAVTGDANAIRVVGVNGTILVRPRAPSR